MLELHAVSWAANVLSDGLWVLTDRLCSSRAVGLMLGELSKSINATGRISAKTQDYLLGGTPISSNWFDKCWRTELLVTESPPQNERKFHTLEFLMWNCGFEQEFQSWIRERCLHVVHELQTQLNYIICYINYFCYCLSVIYKIHVHSIIYFIPICFYYCFFHLWIWTEPFCIISSEPKQLSGLWVDIVTLTRYLVSLQCILFFTSHSLNLHINRLYIECKIRI